MGHQSRDVNTQFGLHVQQMERHLSSVRWATCQQVAGLDGCWFEKPSKVYEKGTLFGLGPKRSEKEYLFLTGKVTSLLKFLRLRWRNSRFRKKRRRKKIWTNTKISRFWWIQVVRSNENPYARSKISLNRPYAKFTLATRWASAESWCVRHWVSKVKEKPCARNKILTTAKKKKKKKNHTHTPKTWKLLEIGGSGRMCRQVV